MPRKVQRTNTISIRLTDSEKLDWELKAHAAGLTISKLAREAMGRVKVTNVSDRALQKERTRQIAKIGNNLNQIARWANTYKSTAEAVEVVTHLIAIEKALLALSHIKADPGDEQALQRLSQTVETAIAESGMDEATLARALDLSSKEQ